MLSVNGSMSNFVLLQFSVQTFDLMTFVVASKYLVAGNIVLLCSSTLTAHESFGLSGERESGFGRDEIVAAVRQVSDNCNPPLSGEIYTRLEFGLSLVLGWLIDNSDYLL